MKMCTTDCSSTDNLYLDACCLEKQTGTNRCRNYGTRERADSSRFHYGTCWSFYVSLGNIMITLRFIVEHSDPSTFHYETYRSIYVSVGNILILLRFTREHTDPSAFH